MDGITRGDLAQQCGVNPETIRYYERHQLLPLPARSPSGYRLFTQVDAARIRFIKRAQSVGFSLEEIRTLLDMRLDPDGTSGQVRDLAEEKLAAIDEKIRSLQAVRDTLVSLIQSCPGGDAPINDCPILDSLEHEAFAPSVNVTQPA
jgi:Cu(I)-responsive transcriptional regulator